VRKNKFFILPLCLVLLVSCNGSSGGSKSSRIHSGEEIEALETPDGTFLAVFKAVNSRVTGTVTGALSLLKVDDQFIADLRLSNGNPNVVHRQNVYIGTNCPDASADINADGIIDIIEARPFMDSVLIPLDGDLNSQAGNSDYWPVSDQYGGYLWGKISSYANMLEDLRGLDDNANDNITKIARDELLKLVGKTVLIQGVADTTPLPDTVATMGRYNKFQTLPVACGVITRVTKAPGVVDNTDETGIPVPEGETVGGSSGANDGAIFRYGETTGGESF
jgi:hypothetical protein